MILTKKNCHRCNTEEGFTVLLNSKGNCYSCDGAGYLSETHATLFELGFAEEVNLDGEYSMELYKKYNVTETIEVQVKRVGGNFVIHEIRFHSPYAQANLDRIHDVKDLIGFLNGMK